MKSFKDLKPRMIGGLNKALAVCTAFVLGTGGAYALPPNTEPTVSDASMTVAEDNADLIVNQVNFAAGYADIDGDPMNTIKFVTLPANGGLYVYNGPSNIDTITAGMELPIADTSKLVWEPFADFNGSDSFQFNISDGNAYATTPATVTLSVSSVNDAPTDITITNINIDENQPIGSTVGFMSTVDVDAGDSHTYTLVSGAGATDNGSFDIVANKLVTDVAVNYEVKSIYTVRVRSTDGSGASTEKQITVNINNINDKPVTSDLSQTATAGQPFTFNSGWFINNFTDEDGDPMSKIQIVTLPMYGTLELSGAAVTAGDDIAVLDINDLVYTPNSSFAGYDTIEFKGHDGTDYADGKSDVSIKVLGPRGGATTIGGAGTISFGNAGSSNRPSPTVIDTTGGYGNGLTISTGGNRPVGSRGVIDGTGAGDPTSNKMAPDNGIIAGIENPAELIAHNSYPNPFSDAVTIRYDLPAEYSVVVKVYNELGQEVRTLADGPQAPGTQQVTLDGSDLEIGQYFYNIILTDANGVQVATKAGIMVKMK